MAKKWVWIRFVLRCNLHFGKITSGFTLTEWWMPGNYYIIFWSMMSKFSSEIPVLFLYIYLYICSIYIAKTHFTTTLYKKMEQIYKNKNGLSLLNSAFDITDQKIINYGSYQPPIAQSRWNWNWFFKTLNANYTMKKTQSICLFFAITIRMITTFLLYLQKTQNWYIYTLKEQ